MSTTLRQILTVFEESREPISVSKLASQLDRPPELLEGMLDYWVRKGRLRVSSGHESCGSCAKDGDCAFVMDMPRSYELVGVGELIGLEMVVGGCEGCSCHVKEPKVN